MRRETNDEHAITHQLMGYWNTLTFRIPWQRGEIKYTRTIYLQNIYISCFKKNSRKI